MDKGLLILASWGEFLEKLVFFRVSLKLVGEARQSASADLQPTIWRLFWWCFGLQLVPS